MHSVTIVTNDWPGVKCQPNPPTHRGFLAVVKRAYTAQVCAASDCVQSLKRPADKRRDTKVFILNMVFIDGSYQFGRLVGSRITKGGGGSHVGFILFSIFVFRAMP